MTIHLAFFLFTNFCEKRKLTVYEEFNNSASYSLCCIMCTFKSESLESREFFQNSVLESSSNE